MRNCARRLGLAPLQTGTWAAMIYTSTMRSKTSAAKKKFLLVAEDDESVGSVVCEALQTAGFKTHWVKDGIEALNYVLESRPDGIVLDLVLPRLSGFEICGMVRKSRAIQWTP